MRLSKALGLCCLGLPASTAAPTLGPDPLASQNVAMTGSATPKPRMIALTDVVSAEREPDDMQSLVHLLSTADMFQIDGIVSTTGWNIDNKTEMYRIHDVIDAYEKDLPNLMKRNGQTDFLDDETDQLIGYWPSPAYLRRVVAEGQTKMGMGGVGDGKATNGSELMTSIIDRDDPYGRPVWVSFWGSGNTLAQTLWDVQKSRSDAAVDDFLSRIRIYTITDQDRPFYPNDDYTGVPGTTHTWMRKTFGSRLFYIWSETAWRQLGRGVRDRWSQYQSSVLGKGALGSLYPEYKYTVEGDTSSWVYAWPGVNQPDDPSQWGYGGRFVDKVSHDNATRAYMDTGGDDATKCADAIARTVQDQMNDFIARIEWASGGKGNRNPVVVINGDCSHDVAVVHAAPGAEVRISAAGTTDPDGNALDYTWSQDTEVVGAGWSEDVPLGDTAAQDVGFVVPPGAQGRDIHLMLRVADDGSPSLATWRRTIVRVAKD